MPFWERWRKEPEREAVSEAKPVQRRRGIAFGAVTDVGRVRPANQDHLFALVTSVPSLTRQLSLGLFIVADGMGGHIGGAAASSYAVEVVAAYVLQGLLLPILRGDSPEAIQDLLQGALHAANRRVRDEGSRLGNDMGTTVTTALVLEGRCHVAHVGDSRLYTYGQDGLQVRTRDHSMVARLLELGQITPEEAHDHPKRNYLYQSIGQQEGIDIDDPFFSLEDCSHILLCSDGLWGLVSEEELAKGLTEISDPQQACEHLTALANAAGGEDNISVIVVALPTPPKDHRP